MKFFFLVLFTALALGLTNCNRGAQQTDNETTSVVAKKDLSTINDFGAEAISRLEKRVDVTDEQKASIMAISKEIGFADAEGDMLKALTKQFRERIAREVLTKEQRAKMKKE